MTKETWGNIELPGLGDDELLAKNWNCVAANKERNSNKEIKRKTVEAIHKKQSSEEYQQAFADGIKRRQESDWAKNVKEGCKKRTEDWRTNQANALRKKLAKSISTPAGIFPSITEAINYYFDNKLTHRSTRSSVEKWIRCSIKKPESGFYLIENNNQEGSRK